MIEDQQHKQRKLALLTLLMYAVALGMFFWLVTSARPSRPSFLIVGSVFGVALGLASVAAIWIAWGSIALSYRCYIGGAITSLAAFLVLLLLRRGGPSDRYFFLLPFAYCVIAAIPLFLLRIKYGFRLTRQIGGEDLRSSERYQFSIRRLIEFTAVAGFVFVAMRPLSAALSGPAAGPGWIEIAGVMLAMICGSIITAWLSIILALGTPRTGLVILILCLIPPIGMLEAVAVNSVTGSGPDLKWLFVAKEVAQVAAVIWPMFGLRAYGYQLVRAASDPR